MSSCTVADWTSLLPAVKAELELFPARAGWGRVSPTCERVPSIARAGNLLEAINCALDACCLRHVDRDAHRVGNHMAFVSAGTATFDVTCTLAKVTKRRMNDLGASCDLIIVSSRPMHQAPLFVIADSSLDSTRGAPLSRSRSAATVEYKLPQWLMGQYYSGSHVAAASDSFHPLPFSQVFSREGYRLSEHGCTVPVALLTVLRRMHRASNIVYRTLLSRADEADLPVSRTRRESVSMVSAPSMR